MKKICLLLILFSTFSLSAKENILIWPKGYIKGVPNKPIEKVHPPRTSGIIAKRITDVPLPNVDFYATKETGARPLVIICPGGGYSGLAVGHEGSEVASYLNSNGFHAAVLKYRVPKQREAALNDAQRTIRLLRHHAKEWNINPKKIGIMGFSAGGHLAASASVRHAEPTYKHIDEIDRISARPDFTILVYPAYMITDGKLSPEFQIDETTPPALLIHADNDRHSSAGSLAYALALKQFKTTCEVHIFALGGHGFGIRNRGFEIDLWPALMLDWLNNLSKK
jgi:acetyl esterase/lipase